MLNKLFTTTLFFIISLGVSFAQQFDYNFSQRVEPYENLEQSVPISETLYWFGEAWDIPIGFEFDFFDYSFDSVTVYCASTLYFGYAEYQEALFFSGFSQALVDRGILRLGNSLSPISYTVSGTSPDRINKIEFRNAGFHQGSAQDSVHLQIWLFEADNAIEVHLGPHHISGPEVYETIDAVGPTIGFVNDLDEKYAFLYDAPQSLEFGFPPFSFAGMESTWPIGQVYRFAPQSSPVQEPQETIQLKLWPNPSSQWLHISADQPLQEQQMKIFDTTGRLQLTQFIHNKAQINISTLPAGIYNLIIETEGIRQSQTFVKQ